MELNQILKILLNIILDLHNIFCIKRKQKEYLIYFSHP